MEKREAASRQRALAARLQGQNIAKYPKEEPDAAAVAGDGDASDVPSNGAEDA